MNDKCTRNSRMYALLDTGSSISTAGTPNPVGDLEEQADIGIAIQDEFVNQALYSLWRGGVLCQTIDEDVRT